jgi:ammonium transporter, Amt family
VTGLNLVKGVRWLLPVWLISAVLMSFILLPSPAFGGPADETVAAASEPAADPAAAAPEAEAAPEYYSKKEIDYTLNTLMMLICGILVIFMQGGFAMVEVGLNASKNAVNILFKNLMDFSLGCILYLLIGYGLMYPGADYAGKWFGYAGPFVARDLETPNATGWSSSADFLFQVAFAATAATIVSGAVAGRMKFSAYLVYSAVITAFVYPISGMWKWGGGWLAAEGFADFAGSVVVHAVGGFAGLAGAMLLGPRIGRYTADGKSVPMLPHNMTFAALGVFILWVGWYGFNPGSQLTYSGVANAEVTSYVAVTTTLSGAAGACVAMVLSWVFFRKPDLSMTLNGALAGLVGITANCNQVEQTSALIIGVISGVLVFAGIVMLDKLRIDDPVGAFPVHGLCGAWGGIATGIFGTALPVIDGTELSRTQYIILQCKGTVVVAAWAFVTMFILFAILKAIGMLRVHAHEEIEGLDTVEHGMPAYGHDGGGMASASFQGSAAQA